MGVTAPHLSAKEIAHLGNAALANLILSIFHVDVITFGHKVRLSHITVRGGVQFHVAEVFVAVIVARRASRVTVVDSMLLALFFIGLDQTSMVKSLVIHLTTRFYMSAALLAAIHLLINILERSTYARVRASRFFQVNFLLANTFHGAHFFAGVAATTHVRTHGTVREIVTCANYSVFLRKYT